MHWLFLGALAFGLAAAPKPFWTATTMTLFLALVAGTITALIDINGPWLQASVSMGLGFAIGDYYRWLPGHRPKPQAA